MLPSTCLERSAGVQVEVRYKVLVSRVGLPQHMDTIVNIRGRVNAHVIIIDADYTKGRMETQYKKRENGKHYVDRILTWIQSTV